MPNMQERLETTIERTETDSSLFHDMVHGGDNQTVTTENGIVPTMAKALKDVHDELYGQASSLVNMAQLAADEAKIAAGQAKAATLQTEQNAQNVADNLVKTKTEVSKAQIWAEGTDDEVQAQGGTHSCREWVALAERATIGSFPITVAGVAKENQMILPLNLDEALGSVDQILAVIIENTALLPENYTLSQDGRSVVLLNPLATGERWCVKCLYDLQSMNALSDCVMYEEMSGETR